MGLWPNANPHRVAVIPAMIGCIIVGLVAPMTYALFKVHRHLPLVVDNLNVTLNTIVACVKLFLLWQGRDVIESLVMQVWHDWLTYGESIIDAKTMQIQASRARRLTMISSSTILFCYVIFITMPMLNLSIRSLNNITDVHPSRYMPAQSYYPYNVYQSPIFELTYIHQLTAGFLTVMSFTVPENFFAALTLHACAQCQIIENQFQRLANCSTTLSKCRYFVERLRRIVDHHNRLIQFVDNIETLFNRLILAHMLFLTAIIGCLGFTLLEVLNDNADSSQILRVTTFAATSMDLLMYTLIYCGTAELLNSNSFRLHGAVYQTNLQLLPKHYARDIIIVMMRSQTPLKLTAGKFFVLSLNTYLKLVKNAVGFISMLITLHQ